MNQSLNPAGGERQDLQQGASRVDGCLPGVTAGAVMREQKLAEETEKAASFPAAVDERHLEQVQQLRRLGYDVRSILHVVAQYAALPEKPTPADFASVLRVYDELSQWFMPANSYGQLLPGMDMEVAASFARQGMKASEGFHCALGEGVTLENATLQLKRILSASDKAFQTLTCAPFVKHSSIQSLTISDDAALLRILRHVEPALDTCAEAVYLGRVILGFDHGMRLAESLKAIDAFRSEIIAHMEQQEKICAGPSVKPDAIVVLGKLYSEGDTPDWKAAETCFHRAVSVISASISAGDNTPISRQAEIIGFALSPMCHRHSKKGSFQSAQALEELYGKCQEVSSAIVHYPSREAEIYTREVLQIAQMVSEIPLIEV